MGDENQISKEQRENAKKTLSHKLYHEVLGNARVKQSSEKFSQLVNPGVADYQYESLNGNEEIQKDIEGRYNQEKEDIERYGLPGEARREDLNDYSLRIARSIGSNMQILTLNDLEKIVKDVSGVKVEVPDAMKDHGIYSIAGKSEKDLNNFEKGVAQYYGLLNETFWKAVTLNSVNKQAYADVNAMAQDLGKKYNPNGEDKKK